MPDQAKVTAAYEAAAPNYDSLGVPFFTIVGARLVQEARISVGDHVLDVGCGAGAVTIPAARAVGAAGHVTAVDLSPRMLDRTTESAVLVSLENVTTAIADAQDPPYASGSFDAVLASMLMFLLPEPEAAVRAWNRLLRPDGTVALSWIVAEDPRWVPVIAAVDALAGGASFAGLWQHPPFTGPTEVAELLAGAGYDDITTTMETVPRRYTGPRQWWAASWTQAPMLAWQHIPLTLRVTARDAAFRLLDDMRAPDGSLTRETVIGFSTARRRPAGSSRPGPGFTARRSQATESAMPKVRDMDTDSRSTQSAEARRAVLISQLREQGAIRSQAVADAFRAVPRHLFAPDEPLERAYANEVLVTKRDQDGSATSSISAPWLQATMLEQAQLGPGMCALEIGSGGYNAALMAELVGEAGAVTTVDIDPDVTGRASRCLAGAGYARVNVVLGDAENGVTEYAPYDRIIVTAGAWDIAPAWMDQLTPGGRLVVPLRLHGLTRSVAFQRVGGHLESLGHEMCGFVPIQGAGARRERRVPLHGDEVSVRIDDGQPVDADALVEALRQPRAEAWTGVRFGGAEPFDGLYLWLVTCLPHVGLLARRRTETARELADPSSPSGTPTLVEGRSFAYHTFRKVDPAADIYEFGAYGHGPNAARLAEQMAEQIRVWDRDHRHGAAARIAVYPAGTPDDQLPSGWVIDKRHTRVSISWPWRTHPGPGAR